MVRFVFVLFPFLQLSITATCAAAFVPRQKPGIAARRASILALGTKHSIHPANRNGAIPPAVAVTTTPDKPIVVLGAGGKTGRIIAQILAEQEQYVCAVTRNGRTLDNIPKTSEPYVSYAVGDVTSFDSVLSVLEPGAAGVVWAATSSGVKKGGGDAFEVDSKGAYFTAKACLACNVPKLAFLSAGCVTHPNALGAKAVNTMTQWTYGKLPWTDAKLAGEAAVRQLYRNRTRNKTNLAYVIIRPAASLSNKTPIPVDDLLVMQGDVYSSAQTISRTNVAHVVVGALMKGKATDSVTFEVAPARALYKYDEGNVLDLLNLPTKKQTTIPDLPKALVHRNALSYDDLLDGLVTDEEMIKQYGSIISDYRGVGNLSVEELAYS